MLKRLMIIPIGILIGILVVILVVILAVILIAILILPVVIIVLIPKLNPESLIEDVEKLLRLLRRDLLRYRGQRFFCWLFSGIGKGTLLPGG